MHELPGLEGVSVGLIRRALLQRRRLVFATVAGFIALGLAYNSFVAPVYRATVRVEIRKPPARSPWTGEPAPSGSYQSDNVAMYTTAELVRSRVLLGRLVTDLNAPGSRLAGQLDDA